MKKKETKTEPEISFFMEDANFFTLWLLTDPRLYSKEIFDLDEISPLPQHNYARIFRFLAAQLKIAEVEFPHLGLYSDVTPEQLSLPIRIEETIHQPDEDRQAIVDASLNFRDGGFGIEDLELMGRIRSDFWQYTYFAPEFSPDEIKKLRAHLDAYIDKFLNEELFVYDRNYFLFEKQKELFIEKLKAMSALERYGSNFVISTTTSLRGSKSDPNDGFLFVHTLYALQKLGYIGVMRLWYEEEPMESSRCTYYANIVILPPLESEMTEQFRTENPATVYEGYDEKLCSLKFAGKTIELSKKKKETDAVLLMKTLQKEPDRYWHQDEILEDWGYQPDDETSKHKIYYAARKINELVQRETGQADFIDHNTAKFRVNPKYLKS